MKRILSIRFENIQIIKRGQSLDQNVFIRKIVDSLYVRNDIELTRGHFRVKGENVDIYLAYDEKVVRVNFAWDEIESITEIDLVIAG